MQEYPVHTRRLWQRQASNIPISLILEDAPFKAHDQATTVDISPRGASVRTQLALVRGEWLNVATNGEFTQAMAAIVVWVRYDQASQLTSAGLEFC
jgi:hypothetical protein